MDKKNLLLQRIQEMYSANTPFSLKVLKMNLGRSFSYSFLKIYMSRLVKSGDLKRFANGVYFYPSKDSIIPAEFQGVDPFDVLKMKYMDEFDGFEIGLSFANKIGLTSQVPATYEIVSKNIKERERTVFVGNIKALIRKAPDSLNEKNYYAMQIRYLLKDIDFYSEKSRDESLRIIDDYAEKHGVNRIDYLALLTNNCGCC